MMNVLFATHNVVIVAKPEPFCILGVQNFVKMMWTVKRGPNCNLKLAGILITDVETGSVGHQKGEAALRESIPKFVFESRIRHSRPLYNAVLAHMDIFSYAPNSIGASDYQAFIDEFVTKIK